MPQRSKTVAEKIAELYAIMATEAAKRAIQAIKGENSNCAEAIADRWAEMTAKWLDKSSADRARWTYRAPPH